MKFPKKNSAINTSLLNNQSILNGIPDSYIAEIQQIKIDLKEYDGNDILQMYLSRLSQSQENILKKLSREDKDLFVKILSSQPYLGHNPNESPISEILKKQEYIEKAWKVVSGRKNDLRLRMEAIKKILIPIIESKSDDETIKLLEKIPYDSTYSKEGFIREPYISAFSLTVIYPKFEWDRATGKLLDEMNAYEEKDMIIEFIPILVKVINIVKIIRRAAEKTWMETHLKNGKYRDWKIHMHNATGHITCGLELYTLDTINRLKLAYPNIIDV